MKYLAALVAALAATTTAAPVLDPRSFGTDLTALLQKIGISIQTNSNSHGSLSGAITFTFPKVSLSLKRFVHEITWPKGYTEQAFMDWSTFKANGVNLGAWLEQERTHDPAWWDSHAPGTIDEWNFCAQLGNRCGTVLEERYATFITISDIDKLASVGVNVLRIPTTYAAWVRVPGSNLYTGNQQKHLSKIVNYAIEKYNMHIIIGLHSLPGGVNSLDIGEGVGRYGWFNNATNLDYSFQAIDAILAFIKGSGHINAFTVAPLNEASDTNLVGFGSAAGLTANGTDWINTYVKGVLLKIAKLDKRIPLMLQDCFEGPDYWAPFYDASTNLVIDSHVYYFAASGVYSQYVAPAICGQAAALPGKGKFPVFVGEWALQTAYNNTFDNRKTIFDTQRYAWQKYASGGAFWTARSLSTTAVDGEGIQEDYWSYIGLQEAGVITSQTNSSYC
ncbi:putative glucan 1,3-beta-glucosidase A [Macrophomina phaseolina]|uniref:glucan 1,3-beta-glucosidase n=1 Tax=Macrophomina phaseolina TaxID=35725 RepID=A0ABQ8GEN9_9PEZI|nr:putative glucan 1,3-beta-glucosidase A [Macrophomina phaseolina]